MEAGKMAAEMRSWYHEFLQIADEKGGIPDRFWPFLANRLSEHGVSEPDPDVVSIRLMEGWRNVRITGISLGRMTYEPADGSVGWGMVTTDKVHPSDKGKLTSILGRLEREGKTGGGSKK